MSSSKLEPVSVSRITPTLVLMNDSDLGLKNFSRVEQDVNIENLLDVSRKHSPQVGAMCRSRFSQVSEIADWFFDSQNIFSRAKNNNLSRSV
jgi:hypothetical protein